MAPPYMDRDANGSFQPVALPTGQKHRLVLRTLKLDHRYHDDDPVQGAAFTVQFANGYQVSGTLDDKGQATLTGVPAGQSEVRYGPDSRSYAPVDQPQNPDYRPQMSSADIDALFDKYQL